MRLFGRKRTGFSGWQKEARAYLASVVGFLNERPERRKISPEESVLERKLIFLLDDLRVAIKNCSSRLGYPAFLAGKARLLRRRLLAMTDKK